MKEESTPMARRERIPWRFSPSLVELGCLVLGEAMVLWLAWLIDDAYVYFRYVDNLLIHGNGLVWNPGEYVEGFSSPLWTLLLSALRVLRLNYWLVVRLVGMLCFAAFWWLACLVNRKLTPALSGKSFGLNLPLVYLTFTYGVICYFTSGLEGPLVGLWSAVFAAAVLWPASTWMQIAVGISPLVRPELLPPMLVVLAYNAYRRRKTPVPMVVSFLVGTGGYLLFRVWYYASLLPNTFYLKDEVWISQGLRYLCDALIAYHTVPYLLAALVVLVALCRSRGRRNMLAVPRGVMALTALPVLLYVVKIGGDPRHFRFLAFPFCLVVLATGGLLETVAERFRKGRRYIYVLCAAFALWEGSNYPRQLRHHPLLLRAEPGQEAFMLIKDASVHRLHESGFSPPPFESADFLSWGAAETRYRRSGDAGRVSTESWCVNAYVNPRRAVVQSFGLTDPILARIDLPSGRPAHRYGLLELADDVARIRERYGYRKGAFREAVEDGSAPSWVCARLETIREAERSAFNRHRLGENLGIVWRSVF
ncbi:hypothetical protein GF402_00630 [Candidatus Fermentibacteria bacterium]|nr:hypothetical protein [Candidatus Fermentibacteria bacterium]